MSSRKKPFSHKQKKKQLAEKRIKKHSGEMPTPTVVEKKIDEKRINRLVSEFEKEDPLIIQKRKEEAMKPIVRLPKECLEVCFEDVYPNVIKIPRRPTWTFTMPKTELEEKERDYFRKWQNELYEQYKKEDLSFFEKNLEVWRQLWRVVEISDIVLIIVDIRNPVLHFSPSLYQYVLEKKRKVAVVLMKVDLVSKDTVDAWIDYFKLQFPDLFYVPFSIYSASQLTFEESFRNRSSIRKKRYHCSAGVLELLRFLKSLNLCKPGVAFDWDALLAKAGSDINEDDHNSVDDDCRSIEQDDDDGDEVADASMAIDNMALIDDTLNPKYMTIGLVGHPNVGKSSMINGLVGKKVVSSSRSPGHTKHFQTIHLSPTIRLCDCPGLVFPSLVSKTVQITSGIYPIAQVRDPHYSIKFIAERIPLEYILNLKLPEYATEWSGWAICEAFAIDRGFYTAKGAHPDVYRAANMILRFVADGRILLSWKPPNFFSKNRNPDASERKIEFEAKIEHEASQDTEDEEEDLNCHDETNPFDALVEE